MLDPSLHPAQIPATAWQNTQAAPVYPGSAPPQVPGGQMSSWDPTQQAVRPSYISPPGTFPGQQAVPPIPGYSHSPSTAPLATGSPLAQSNPMAHNASSMGITQPGVPLNANLQPSGSSPRMPASPFAGASPPGIRPYYG